MRYHLIGSKMARKLKNKTFLLNLKFSSYFDVGHMSPRPLKDLTLRLWPDDIRQSNSSLKFRWKFLWYFFQILRLFVTTFDYYSNMNLFFWLNPDQTDYYCKVLFYDRTRGSSNSCSGIIFRDHLQSPL